MDTTKSISSTFSPKSDLALAEIIKKYNLPGVDVKFLIEKFTMFFSRTEISEKEMINYIQKEVGVSQKIAGQIAIEIKNILIPTLWNNLSQKDRESFLHTKKAEEEKEAVPEKISTSPDTKNNFDYEPPKKLAPSLQTVNKKSDGPDKYREPVE